MAADRNSLAQSPWATLLAYDAGCGHTQACRIVYFTCPLCLAAIIAQPVSECAQRFPLHFPHSVSDLNDALWAGLVGVSREGDVVLCTDQQQIVSERPRLAEEDKDLHAAGRGGALIVAGAQRCFVVAALVHFQDWPRGPVEEGHLIASPCLETGSDKISECTGHDGPHPFWLDSLLVVVKGLSLRDHSLCVGPAVRNVRTEAKVKLWTKDVLHGDPVLCARGAPLGGYEGGEGLDGGGDGGARRVVGGVVEPARDRGPRPVLLRQDLADLVVGAQGDFKEDEGVACWEELLPPATVDGGAAPVGGDKLKLAPVRRTPLGGNQVEDKGDATRVKPIVVAEEVVMHLVALGGEVDLCAAEGPLEERLEGGEEGIGEEGGTEGAEGDRGVHIQVGRLVEMKQIALLLLVVRPVAPAAEEGCGEGGGGDGGLVGGGSVPKLGEHDERIDLGDNHGAGGAVGERPAAVVRGGEGEDKGGLEVFGADHGLPWQQRNSGDVYSRSTELWLE